MTVTYLSKTIGSILRWIMSRLLNNVVDIL